MTTDSRKIIVCLLSLGLSAGSFAQDGEAKRKPLFGETHIHTAYSFDAYLFNTRATPDDAYNFAKGKPLKHPLGATHQLKRPLDFMTVTDHGFFMGSMIKMTDSSHRLSKHPLAAIVNDPDQRVRRTAFRAVVTGQIDGKPADMAALADLGVQQDTWERVIESANRHNDPGTFTTFIGYEWTSTPNGQNMHRNVIFKGDTAPLPFTRIDSQDPEDLWAWMDKIRADGFESLAIPHNTNKSDGLMFERATSDGSPFTEEYAARRNRNEPLVEVTQIKGTSETHPMLSPNDEFADFEIDGSYVATPKKITKFAGSYVRNAYRTGLEFQDTLGVNPYRFGLIGSSDSHSAIVDVNEDNFSRNRGSASGLAGVWAEENTRESIYDALRRKETWGTSGPRITVRFFGGFDMKGVTPGDDDWVQSAYANGVSMGGELKGSSSSEAPTFAVWAIKDVESGNLDRIQIVKGWSEDGESQEQVYDAVWSNGRVKDPATGKLPVVGNTVDLKTAKYTNSIGAVELMGLWTDPDFNAKQNAFYYVRVLEIPTPRWNLYDEVALGRSFPENLARVIQERAYTSPIWYDHN